MIEFRHRPRPENWNDFHRSIQRRWLLPFFFIDWIAAWAAYGLSRASLLEFLEYCGSFSILVGVIFYFIETPERTKLKHYQAWQVINTAQGKGGSGGRAEALHELNDDHVALVGVDLSDAFLQGLQLKRADLRRSNFHGADLKDCDLSGANLEQGMLIATNLRNGKLVGVRLNDAALNGADLTQANLSGCNFHNVDLEDADLTDADLAGVQDWTAISNIKGANIFGVRNAPQGFIEWAIGHGASNKPAR